MERRLTDFFLMRARTVARLEMNALRAPRMRRRLRDDLRRIVKYDGRRNGREIFMRLCRYGIYVVIGCQRPVYFLFIFFFRDTDTRRKNFFRETIATDREASVSQLGLKTM